MQKRTIKTCLLLGYVLLLLAPDTFGQLPPPVVYPVVYSDAYNIGLALGRNFCGDGPTQMIRSLVDRDYPASEIVSPEVVDPAEFLRIHNRDYLTSLRKPSILANITGISTLADVDSDTLTTDLLNPLCATVSGTVTACYSALERGIAINLGGGYHHAHRARGSGINLYADIPFALTELWKTEHNLRILIVDLDAQYGSGLVSMLGEEFKKEHPRVGFFGICRDASCTMTAKGSATREGTYGHEVVSDVLSCYFIGGGVEKATYTNILYTHLIPMIWQFKGDEERAPMLIIYIAGSNVSSGHSVGFKFSSADVVARDLFVVGAARECHVPIAILYSSIYDERCLEAITQSLRAVLAYKPPEMIPFTRVDTVDSVAATASAPEFGREDTESNAHTDRMRSEVASAPEVPVVDPSEFGCFCGLKRKKKK